LLWLNMPEPSVAEILRRVQRIQVVADRKVDDLLAGQYRSVFRGRGIEFDDVREYQPGDDIRTIDWNVTARTGTAFIKRFCEERELTVYFLIDVSASGAFGSQERSKLELVVEVAAVLMFSALKNHDKIGLLTFCGGVLEYYPPRKGRTNALRMIRQLVAVQPVPQRTDLAAALEFLNRVQKRRAVAFLMSDFLAPSAQHAMAVTSRRHDLVAITVADPRECELPDVGLLRLRDAETGRIVKVDTHNRRLRELFRAASAQRRQQLSEELKRIGVDELAIRTDQDYVTSLRRFFHMRERRLR
jgi:uncharacterized protein (DUF58 family)